MAGRLQTMNNVFLILGGNLGERKKNLDEAISLLGKKAGNVKRFSSVYETQPWGVKDQPHYFNQVIEMLTDLSAQGLMTELLQIEKKMGRVREKKYGSRTIDIDILFFNDAIINTESLTVPHPRLHERRFVLEPMNEIAHELMHPILQKTIAELLTETTDESVVKKL